MKKLLTKNQVEVIEFGEWLLNNSDKECRSDKGPCWLIDGQFCNTTEAYELFKTEERKNKQ